MPSGRLLFLLLLGGIPSLMAPWLAQGPLLTVFLDVAFLCLGVWDYRRIPNVASLDVQRILPDRSILGEPIVVVIRICSKAPLFVRLVDGSTGGGEDGPIVLGGWVAPGTPLKLSYQLTPNSRGQLCFEPAWLRLRSPLFLVWRDGSRSIPGQVPVHLRLKVNPKGALPMSVLKRAVGAHVGKHPGVGGEFLALREQAPGEGGTRVDWKATARRGVPIVRQFAEERVLSIVFVIDCSMAMNQKIEGVSRLDHAIDATLSLAQEASYFGDRVGFLAIREKGDLFLPPRSGARAMPEIRRLTLDLKPSLRGLDLGESLRTLEKHRLQSSVFMIFTDIPSAASAINQRRALGLLGRRHRVILATLKDGELAHCAKQTVDDGLSLYQRAAALTLLEERRGGRRSLGAKGIAVVESAPGGLLTALQLRYHRLRSSGRV